MTDPLIPPGAPEFVALFEAFTAEAFQVETRQVYGGAGEDADFAAFLAGESPPGGHDAWLDMVRRNRRAGRTMRRVHFVVEPLSNYMRYELAWPYKVCTDAGEDIRIVVASDLDPWSTEMGYGDFWLFDSARLYRQYHDVEGRWLGTEPVTDPDSIGWARTACESAWSVARPWADYVANHPDLAGMVPSNS